MLQIKKDASKLLMSVLEQMSTVEGNRLMKDVTKRFSEIITGNLKREFKITTGDILQLLSEGHQRAETKCEGYACDNCEFGCVN